MKQVRRTTLTRNMQRVLNRFGFTDDGGNSLKEDGVYGDKTKRAVKKFSKYQEELRKPSYATKKWQEGINNAGYRDSEGKTLKTDGVHGSKTDTATTQFENDFLGTLDKTYQPKTVQKKAFPSTPEYDFGELVGTLKQENGADKILGIQTEPNKFKELFLKEISKQGGKTKTKNMVYNMKKGDNEGEKVKKLNDMFAPKPTQPPQGIAQGNEPDWSEEWNATPQYEEAGKPNNGADPKNRNIAKLIPGEKDWAGELILDHYLGGSGEEMVIEDEPKWSNYIKNNPTLKQNTKNIVNSQALNIRNGETKEIDVNVSGEFENGEGMIGTQYLHGTNSDVGGYHVKGTISKDKNGNIITNLQYTWNDVIDPNPQYTTDKQKDRIAHIIADPKPYTIRITWTDQSTITKDGTKGGGWLG